jgi:hypothetical protein
MPDDLPHSRMPAQMTVTEWQCMLAGIGSLPQALGITFHPDIYHTTIREVLWHSESFIFVVLLHCSYLRGGCFGSTASIFSIGRILLALNMIMLLFRHADDCTGLPDSIGFSYQV